MIQRASSYIALSKLPSLINCSDHIPRISCLCLRPFEYRLYPSPQHRFFSTTVQTIDPLDYPQQLSETLKHNFTISDILKSLPKTKDGSVLGIPREIEAALLYGSMIKKDHAELSELMNLFESGRVVPLITLTMIKWVQPPSEFAHIRGPIYHHYIESCIKENAGEADNCRFLYKLVCSLYFLTPNRSLRRSRTDYGGGQPLILT
jgi:hypothetical protein